MKNHKIFDFHTHKNSIFRWNASSRARLEKLKNVIRRLENSHTRPHNDVKNLWWSFECSNDDDRYQCSFTLLSPILTRSVVLLKSCLRNILSPSKNYASSRTHSLTLLNSTHTCSNFQELMLWKSLINLKKQAGDGAARPFLLTSWKSKQVKAGDGAARRLCFSYHWIF